jgi:hypothetical protein
MVVFLTRRSGLIALILAQYHLEYLRPKVKEFLTRSDEADLFTIANNFGVRHHNDTQKTGYDAALWLSWMFYFYLATIHVLLRKMNLDAEKGT